MIDPLLTLIPQNTPHHHHHHCRNSQGPNAVINCTYNLLASRLFAGYVCYESENGKLFIYHHPSNPAWLIGTSIGDLSAPAYVASHARLPHLITVRFFLGGGGKYHTHTLYPDIGAAPQEPWNVAAFGQFQIDADVRVQLVQE